MKLTPKLLTLAALVLVCAACETTEYVIDTGDHYATKKVAVFTGDHLGFNARFDDSASYQTVDPQNQGDINKLRGFSDCSSHHHKNSARFGWRWFDDGLQIHAYTYVDGQRISQLMGYVELDSWDSYSIDIEGDHYVFTLNDTVIEMARGCDGSGGVKYQLYPYFGGDEVAPHQITIEIQEP